MDTAGNSNDAVVAAELSEVSDERRKDEPMSASCVSCSAVAWASVATSCPPPR